MQIEIKLGDRLQLLRKKRGLTLDECQEAIGIHRSQVNSYETNTVIPGAKTLRKLADFYSVSVDYLISGKEEESQLQAREKIATYGLDYQEFLDKLKELEPQVRRDLIESFTVFVDKALEKARQLKKKSDAG